MWRSNTSISYILYGCEEDGCEEETQATWAKILTRETVVGKAEKI